MKVEEIIEEEKVEFKPIELKITIDSEEELCSLWHRLNIGEHAFTRENDYQTNIKHGAGFHCLDDLWNLINEKVKERNLKND